MAEVYAYTPDIWLPLAATVCLAVIAAYSWWRRDVPAALPLAACALFAALWGLGRTLVAAAAAPAAILAWHKFQVIWLLPAVTAGTCFALEYARPGRWLTRRRAWLVALFALPPLLILLLVILNDGQLLWRRLEITADGSVQPTFTRAGLILLAYGMGLVLVNAAALVWLFARSPQHRWPVVLILFGQSANRLVFLLGTLAPLRPPLLELDATASIVPWIAMAAVALFGFRILDPRPAARAAALEQMRDGMIVLDAEGGVASLNRAAAVLLSTDTDRALQDLLSAKPDLRDRLADARCSSETVELALETGRGVRHCALDVSPLRDFRGLPLGHLLMLHDLTEQRRAEALLREQQRTLGVLEERERLARELHDGIGQVMGYTALQLEVVLDRLTDGQAALSAGQRADAHAPLTEAENHVRRLGDVVEEAHADLREFILNLRLAPSEQRQLFATIRHYLDGFSQNYGIGTELSVGPGVDEARLDAGAAMQLFRIIQEAFSNARQHARASRVCLSFEARDGRVRVQIQDNGCGFDPASAVTDAARHLGLGIMQARAEEIGGTLRVESVQGAGTSVVVELPLHASQREEPA